MKGRSFGILFLAYLPFLLLLSLVTLVSDMSHPPIPKFFHFKDADKILHLMAFAALGSCCAFAACVRRGQVALAAGIEAWLLVSFFGILDELHQRMVPPRQSSFADWLADMIGALLGVLVCLWIGKKITQHTNNERAVPKR